MRGCSKPCESYSSKRQPDMSSKAHSLGVWRSSPGDRVDATASAVTVSPISTIASGTPWFEDGYDISGVLGVIAAECLELGAEPVRAQGIQELLDERVVEVFFAYDNIVAHLLQRHKAEPKRRRNGRSTHAGLRPPRPDLARHVEMAGDDVVEPVIAVNGMRSCKGRALTPDGPQSLARG